MNKFSYVSLCIIGILAIKQIWKKNTLHDHGHINTFTLCHVMH
jgi:hypothetical protein